MWFAAALLAASLDPLAARALTGDEQAVAALRAAGQPGVNAIVRVYHQENPAERAMLDRVCAQKDCAWSHLYWYTDFAAAQQASRDTGRPILTLRLLGRLDEELSCANSRFFRTLLYSNATISAYLRDNYILHWQSVRPAPRITIDYGDGRVIERTITGNSIHYVVDADGRVIDAIPGLNSPAAFLTSLENARNRKAPQAIAAAADMPARKKPPTALEASQAVMTKTIVEMPLIAGRPAPRPRLDDGIVFDDNTLALIRLKHGGPIDALLVNLKAAVAADTALNAKLHKRIERMIRQGLSLDALNQRVYAEVFLTPDSDPWLGLVEADVFTAIDREGVVGDGRLQTADGRR